MFEADLFTYLSDDATLASLVAARIFAVLAAQNQPGAYLVFSKITEQRGTSYCASDDVQRDLYQFDSYSKTLATAIAVSRAIKALLVDFQGVMGSTNIASIKLDSESQLEDPEPGLFRVLTTLFIWHGVN